MISACAPSSFFEFFFEIFIIIFFFVLLHLLLQTIPLVPSFHKAWSTFTVAILLFLLLLLLFQFHCPFLVLPFHMPPALAPLPFPSVPITPTQPDSIPASEKQQLHHHHHSPQQDHSVDSILEASRHLNWTAPWRAGLPTPPGDMMNGVAYNTFLPSSSSTATTNPSSYGGKHNGLSLYPYSKFSGHSCPIYQPSSSSSMSSSKPQSHAPSSAKVVPPAESGSRKKTTSSSNNTALPSYLQIPSSISDSRGNLAEFAAQVRSLYAWICVARKQC